MSPFEIGILLWYYARPIDYIEHTGDQPVHQGTLDNLAIRGYLAESGQGEQRWRATDKLRVYVEAMCDLPEPVWAVPTRADEPRR